MAIIQRATQWWSRGRHHPVAGRRCALALAGGGVIGGMYEVGALAALEERLARADVTFDAYVGCSAGSVVASILAGGVSARELYRILDQDLDDPLNFRRNAVYAAGAFRYACRRFGRLVWAMGKNVMTGMRLSIPDMLARAERDLPAGFFSLTALETWVREAFAARGLPNSFQDVSTTLLIPAIDLDRADRAVFGRGELRGVPISRAIAASSAIPGFFEPYTIDGRDYVDGGVGWTGHADLAAECGVDTVFVVNPLVPTLLDGAAVTPMRLRGVYSIMEQASRIYSQNLLTLGLAALTTRFPRARFVLLEPPRTCALLFGPSMSFEASRAALRYGYASTAEWLEAHAAPVVDAVLAPGPALA